MIAALALLLAAAPALGQTEVRCCSQPDAEAAVLGVADVAAAIARGEDANAELRALDRTSKTPALDEVDQAAIREIRKTARIARVRNDAASQLAALTRSALFLLLRYEGGEHAVAEGWCDDGRIWLQRDLGALHSPWPDCGAWR